MTSVACPSGPIPAPPSHGATPSCPPQPESFYPTPPPSPDLVEAEFAANPAGQSAQNSQTPHAGATDEHPSRATAPVAADASEPEPVVAGGRATPFPIWLDRPPTAYISRFRLTTSHSILGALSGSKVLALESFPTTWHRMPYAAAIASQVVPTPDAQEEDHVEAMLGGQGDSPTQNAKLWPLRHHKSHEHVSSIFVQPPTPERVESPEEHLPAYAIDQVAYSVDQVASDRPEKPVAGASSSPPRTASPQPSPSSPSKSASASKVTLPVALQVLPEVRSPPRRNIAMAADSLQIAQRRGRRPRLFGFTEMPDSSGSSPSSSRDGSRNNSPVTSRNTSPDRERTASPLAVLTTSTTPSSTPPAGPATSSPGNFIPRRHPVRARSETHLTTNPSSSNSAIPRRRDNGLKLDFAGIIPVTNQQEMQAAVIPSPYSATLIRKKSGEILKPALKYIGPLGPNGTPLGEQVPQPRTRFESKSLPSTPSCPKYVHFDSQLERVKLFLHDQKPQVVSRGGSPTHEYTTSEGEEFPFPSTDEERDDDKVLQIKLPNFPTSHAPDADLYLESLYLDDDRRSLRGIAVCKNLAFQKWVAIRFTFDWWQTTSEVTATHKDSIKGGAYDRFAFQIKLHDFLGKIEEKTLFLAIRYTTDGREIWDSNGGQNYWVLFEKTAGESTRAQTQAKRSVQRIGQGMGKAVGGKGSQWSVTGGAQDDDRMADLRAKLSRLTGDDLDSSPPQLSLSPGGKDRHSFSFSPRKNAAFSPAASSPTRTSFSSLEPARSDLPSAGPALAARYDFGASLRTTKERRSSNSPNLQGADLPEVRTGLLNYKRNEGHAATEFYSPRFSPNTQVNALPVPSGSGVGGSGGAGGNGGSGGDYFFAPPSASPAFVNSPNVTQGLTMPNLHVQGPSPPAVDERAPTASVKATASVTATASVGAIAPSSVSSDAPTPTQLSYDKPATYTPPNKEVGATTPPQRPGANRAHTSPATVSTPLPSSGASSGASSKNSSPPGLVPSGLGSVSETPSDSPKSPPDVSLPKWSPTTPLDVDGKSSADSLANYTSFIEQFCWGGASNSPQGDFASKRSHSTSSLDTYFSAPAQGQGHGLSHSHSHSHGESALATPRAASPLPFAVATPMSAASSASSYYSSFSRQSTPRRAPEHDTDDVDSVEDGLGGFGGIMGRASPTPTIAC